MYKSILLINKISCFAVWLLLFANLNSSAQTEQGTLMLGGSGSIRFLDHFSMSVSPNIGIFIGDNFALGGTVSLSYLTNRDNTVFSTALVPFARYYFGRGNTRLFGQGSLGYGRNWQRYNFNQEERTSSRGYGIGSAGLGLTRFLTSQIGVEGTLSYSGGYSDGFNGRMAMNLGFQIYLPSTRSN
jgi:hypothetical protein